MSCYKNDQCTENDKAYLYSIFTELTKVNNQIDSPIQMVNQYKIYSYNDCGILCCSKGRVCFQSIKNKYNSAWSKCYIKLLKHRKSVIKTIIYYPANICCCGDYISSTLLHMHIVKAEQILKNDTLLMKAKRY